MLPRLAGRPIRVEFRRSLRAHIAATSIPRRLILLDSEILVKRGDFERILIHEIFHFVWPRLSNASRQNWGTLLATEFGCHATGELGWSAEWRKKKMTASDLRLRTPVWRRYACESFCDSAAWLFAGLRNHDEFTLPARFRRGRRSWFAQNFPATTSIPI